MQPDAWTLRRIAGLVIVSLMLDGGSFVLLAQFSGAPPGSTYVPAHVENGKFVPGDDTVTSRAHLAKRRWLKAGAGRAPARAS